MSKRTLRNSVDRLLPKTSVRMITRRINVQGVGISELNLDCAVDFVLNALKNRTKGYVCVTGVHGVSEAQSDPEFRRILNNAFLNTPDGMPMVWYGKLNKSCIMGRVYGPDLMLRICEASRNNPIKHYLYGGGNGVTEKLKASLRSRFPFIDIVGTNTPPFRPLTPEEDDSLTDEINLLKPDIIWVGLSTPKQERFMSAYLDRFDVTLMFGVGAAFDFHAGLMPQAPSWMQKSGLEWLYRLSKEPKRLWKRYLVNNPLFLTRAALQLTGLRKFPIQD